MMFISSPLNKLLTLKSQADKYFSVGWLDYSKDPKWVLYIEKKYQSYA